MFNLSRIAYLVICLFVSANSLNINAFTKEESLYVDLGFDVQSKVDLYQLTNYEEASFKELLNLNKAELKDRSDSLFAYRKQAIINAELNNPEKAYEYARSYIDKSLDFSILENDSFDKIKDSEEFMSLKNRYLVKIDVLSFIYFYIALIGLFLVVMLNLKKGVDRTTSLLISGFVLIHVLFVLEYNLFITNISLRYPQLYLFSFSIALLYGPLLYFYFKRITQRYIFKKTDILHTLPAVLVLIFFLGPIYSLSDEEKIKMMLGLRGNTYFWTGFSLKATALIIYAFLIGKLHIDRVKGNIKNENQNVSLIWEKNIFRIHVVYVFSYIIYGLSIKIIGESASIIYNSHVIVMSVMIIYAAYMAYTKPELFSERILARYPKYEKSGLTESLSKELSEHLFRLLMEEKIYKDSEISLEVLSNKLGTTRHNTSQIINEHFNMNFFELINKFRIEEAIDVLKSDLYGNLHIIDVAYEVGFNNKVTFNKAFKKQTSQTPSEFIASNLRDSQAVNLR